MLTPPVLRYLALKAAPVPTGIWPPTMPWPPSMFFSFEKKCIEPPLPRTLPVTLPKSSAISSLGSRPQSRPSAWQR